MKWIAYTRTDLSRLCTTGTVLVASCVWGTVLPARANDRDFGSAGPDASTTNEGVAGGATTTATDRSRPDNSQEDEVRVNLVLSPSAACVSWSELERRVRARSARIRFVSDETGQRAYAIVQQLAAGGFSAELELAQEGAPPASRQVEASKCFEALDALALVIAVTFDPDATLSTAETVEAALSRARASIDEKATRTQQRHAALAPAVARAKPPDSSSLTVGPVAHATWGPAPGVMPGFGGHARLSGARGGLWAPGVGLSIDYASRPDFSAPGGRARFSLTVLSLDLCPSALRGRLVSIRPCAWTSAGRLVASGYDTLDPKTVRRGSWAAGVSLWPSVSLGRGFSAFAVVRGGAALVRDEFQFEPVVFHRVSPLVLSAGFGAGFELR